MKKKTVYSCRECGAEHPKWQGQCESCNAWNTLDEHVQIEAPKGARGRLAAGFAVTSTVQALSDVSLEDRPRLSMGMDELDRVLGGGMVAGGVVLLGGDPGIGKSTLLLQALAQHAALSPKAVLLYVSGEESSDQLAHRARRLGIAEELLARIQVLAETSLERINEVMASINPSLVVIDSIQTTLSEQLPSAPGSVAQVRECAAQLTRWAKAQGRCVFLVGHVTKEGAIAGPRVLEHMVDAVLYFEGDGHAAFRVVRAVKNRFGTVNELGVFAMTDRGLRGVSNPSALFLSHAHHGDASDSDGSGRRAGSVPGACVMATQEGSRPLLVEVQALVDTAHIPNPRRLCVGLDPQRLAMLLAVLHRHAGVACFDQDVYLNVVGGMRVLEPAADLAILAAIMSSMRDRALPEGLVVFGELGLSGELRPSPRGQERLREAARLGFRQALVPRANLPRRSIEGLEVVGVQTISEALDWLSAQRG